jgi:hypothetical protein
LPVRGNDVANGDRDERHGRSGQAGAMAGSTNLETGGVGHGKAKKAALSIAVGAVGAGVGLLATMWPKRSGAVRLKQALPDAPTDADRACRSAGESSSPS